MATDQESTSTTTPPMVSFKTVSNTIADFKSKGVLPPKIDKRLFPNFSSTVANQLVAALKFLSLIDEAGVPAKMLPVLVASHGNTEEWQENLTHIVTRAYKPVLDIELDKVHGSHLRDKFKEVFNIEGDPQRKAIAFFLFAARDAGMKLSPYLKLRERGTSKGPRKKREKSDLPIGSAANPGALNHDQKPTQPRKIHEHQAVLIEIINTYPDMKAEMRQGILEVVGFIATKGVMP